MVYHALRTGLQSQEALDVESQPKMKHIGN
jgi:hypothetical protein